MKCGQRSDALPISSENLDFCEICNSEVDCNLIRDSEHIFPDTFSEEIVNPEEHNPRCTVQNISVSVPSNSVSVDKVSFFVAFLLITILSHITVFIIV